MYNERVRNLKDVKTMNQNLFPRIIKKRVTIMCKADIVLKVELLEDDFLLLLLEQFIDGLLEANEDRK